MVIYLTGTQQRQHWHNDDVARDCDFRQIFAMCGGDQRLASYLGRLAHQNQSLSPAGIRQGDNGVAVFWISRHCDPLRHRERDHLTGDFSEPFRASGYGDETVVVDVHDIASVMPSLLYFVNVVSDAGALMVARGSDFLSVFNKPQRDALVMLLLRLHDHQNTAAEILWGLWLLPLAMLVYRSRFLPRFLGVWLAINGFAYVILSFTGVLLPQYENKVFLLSQPALFAELAFMLWLVIKGAKPPALDTSPSLASGY